MVIQYNPTLRGPNPNPFRLVVPRAGSTNTGAMALGFPPVIEIGPWAWFSVANCKNLVSTEDSLGAVIIHELVHASGPVFRHGPPKSAMRSCFGCEPYD